MKNLLACTVLASSLFTQSIAFAESTKSPIFGAAETRLTTEAKNKTVVGKGASADYYGYYGNLYSSYSNYYGNFAYGASSSTSTTYYYYAYYYANQASSQYYSAYYYAYYGY